MLYKGGDQMPNKMVLVVHRVAAFAFLDAEASPNMNVVGADLPSAADALIFLGITGWPAWWAP